MKLTSKTISISLLSILTAITAINSSVRAQGMQIDTTRNIPPVATQLECNASFVKEFTQVPIIKNSTNQTIAAGKVVYWQAYWAGKASGSKQSITLTQPLAPGQTLSTGVKLSGDRNSCRAYY